MSWIQITANEDAIKAMMESLQELYNSIAYIKNTLMKLGLASNVKIDEFNNTIDNVRSVLNIHKSENDSIKIDEYSARFLRLGVNLERRRRAGEIEMRLQVLHDSTVTRLKQNDIYVLDSIIKELSDVAVASRPRLSDLFTPSGRSNIVKVPELSEEIRDPKHQILLASSLIAHDISVLRTHCEDRRRPLAIAFADLDGFKNYNTQFGEVIVDRNILPPILNAVEGAAYGHGRAYRDGGDEFVFILPNTDVAVAAEICLGIKAAVQSVALPGGAKSPGLSVGVWISLPDSHYTNADLKDMASKAKKQAKELGKNRIVIWRENSSSYNESIHGEPPPATPPA